MTYTELKQQWTNYMHRLDLGPQYDFCTALILSRLGRDLRSQYNEFALPLTITDINDGVAMPANYRQTREVQALFQGQFRPLAFLSKVAFNNSGVRGGRPQIYTISGGNLFTKGAGDVVLDYWGTPDNIVATETSSTLDAFPDLYLYAGLAELHRYVQDEVASEKFTVYYKNELREANKSAQSQRTGNRPVMRAS